MKILRSFSKLTKYVLWLFNFLHSKVPLCHLISPALCFCCLTCLLHYSDFGWDTTRRRGSREGWLFPRVWCNWSTKGPWAFFILTWIQRWKLTVFNSKAIKVKEIQSFWGAAAFQSQYEWQWFLMSPFAVASQIGYRTKTIWCAASTPYSASSLLAPIDICFLVIFFVALRRWSLTWCKFCHFALCTVYLCPVISS